MENTKVYRPAGYEALRLKYGLSVRPNWHESAIASGGKSRIEISEGQVFEIYPSTHWPGETAADHLEFALKYDGTNLEILDRLFQKMPPEEILACVQAKPLGKYARRIWYFYEMLTNKTLPLPDLELGNYVDLLEPDKYYTALPHAIPRQRLRDNLLGDKRFCPMVRRTEALKVFENAGLDERGRKVISTYSRELIKRALNYLYTKETKSSFEIEHITPSVTRTERFVALLELAEQKDFFNKSALIELQNRIVDERFQNHEYRSDQNYVGQSVAWQQEQVHYVAPRPEHLHGLMDGMLASHARMLESGAAFHPVLHAAVVSFGFVFAHPFDDGNGRIHRFLMHNILATRGFTPKGLMFPVSAAMLRNAEEYDSALEKFSKPLLRLVDYTLDENGKMIVHNDTEVLYRYVDMTTQAEALFRFIEETIEVELVKELEFLKNYDNTRRAIQEIVDMPGRKIDLFIRFCLQNNGKISERKRASFSELTEAEVEKMEAVFQREYGIGPQRS